MNKKRIKRQTGRTLLPELKIILLIIVKDDGFKHKTVSNLILLQLAGKKYKTRFYSAEIKEGQRNQYRFSTLKVSKLELLQKASIDIIINDFING